MARGAKALLRPPQRAPRCPQAPPVGPAMAGGTPLSPSPGEAALWQGAGTDGSLQDSWTRRHAESTTEPPAQGQRLGAGVGTDSQDNKGCNAFILSTTSVPSSGDRACCKNLQSLRKMAPFLGSHSTQFP